MNTVSIYMIVHKFREYLPVGKLQMFGLESMAISGSGACLPSAKELNEGEEANCEQRE